MVAVTETFTGSSGAAWPGQWGPGYTGSGSSATIEGSAGRLRTSGGTDYAGAFKITRRLTTTFGDFDAVQEFWQGDAAEKFPVLKWRADSALDGVSGYEVSLRTNPVAYRVANYVGTQVGTTTFAMSGTTHYWVRVRVEGSSHKVKFWGGSLGAEPLTGGPSDQGYQIEFSDSTYLTGSYGYSVSIGAASATRDWFVDSVTITDPGAGPPPAAPDAGWYLGPIFMAGPPAGFGVSFGDNFGG